MTVTGGCSCHFHVIALSNRIVGTNNSVANNSHIRGTNVLDQNGRVRELGNSLTSVRGRLSKVLSSCGLLLRSTSTTGTRLRNTRNSLLETGRRGVHHRNRLGLTDSGLTSISSNIGRLLRRGRALRGEVRSMDSNTRTTHSRVSRLGRALRGGRGRLRDVANSDGALRGGHRRITSGTTRVELHVISLRGSIRTGASRVAELGGHGANRLSHLSRLSRRVHRVRRGGSRLETLARQLSTSRGTLGTGRNSTRGRVGRLVSRHSRLRGRTGSLELRRHTGSRRHRHLDNSVTHLRRHGVTVHGRCSGLADGLCSRCRLAHHRTTTLRVRVSSCSLTTGHLTRLGSRVHTLNSMGISTVRRCGRMSRHCRFLSKRVGSIRASHTRLGGVVSSLANGVTRRFHRRFGHVGSYFKRAFVRLFNKNGTRLQLRSRHSILNDSVRVGIRPPNGGIRGVGLLSNNRGKLSTVTLLFTVLGMAPTPFYFFSRIRTTLSSIGISHCTRCIHHVAGGARFVLVARHHNAVRRTSMLCNIAVRRGNMSGLLRLGATRVTGGLNLTWVLHAVQLLFARAHMP